jgi:hypothetical protein
MGDDVGALPGPGLRTARLMSRVQLLRVFATVRGRHRLNGREPAAGRFAQTAHAPPVWRRPERALPRRQRCCDCDPDIAAQRSMCGRGNEADRSLLEPASREPAERRRRLPLPRSAAQSGERAGNLGHLAGRATAAPGGVAPARYKRRSQLERVGRAHMRTAGANQVLLLRGRGSSLAHSTRLANRRHSVKS